MSGLVLGPDSNVYGTTSQGGANGWGCVFKVSQFLPLTTVYLISTNGLDGAYPVAGLIVGSDGNAFMVPLIMAASNNAGTIFRLTPNGALTILHLFGTLTNAGGFSLGWRQSCRFSVPNTPDGEPYGTFEFGGANNVGTIFKITITGVFTTLVAAIVHVLRFRMLLATELILKRDFATQTVATAMEQTASVGFNGVGTDFQE